MGHETAELLSARRQSYFLCGFERRGELHANPFIFIRGERDVALYARSVVLLLLYNTMHDLRNGCSEMMIYK